MIFCVNFCKKRVKKTIRIDKKNQNIDKIQPIRIKMLIKTYILLNKGGFNKKWDDGTTQT